ncbi:DUF3416 domain-containing protein [Microlunatus sp. Gsoil 973]|nr:DUF3416 domain-containing protein [Microlunatus sp. Gsoil 973]
MTSQTKGSTAVSPITRIPVLKPSPVIGEGVLPAKAAIGEVFTVAATVFREGHDAVGAQAVLTDPDGRSRTFPMHPIPRRGSTGGVPTSNSTGSGSGRSGSRGTTIPGRPGCTTPRSRFRPVSMCS